MNETRTSGDLAPPTADPSDAGALGSDNRESFRARWLEIQSSFIDEPRGAVEEADRIVRELLSTISSRIEESRARLRGDRENGEEPSTESLRRALQAYRAIFDRLLEL